MKISFMELWIIDTSGALYLHICRDNLKDPAKINPQLFSGILTSIEMMSADQTKSIFMKDSKIHILPDNKIPQYFIVVRTDLKQKDGKIQKVLQKIKNRFNQRFSLLLDNWNGETSQFKAFRKEIIHDFF